MTIVLFVSVIITWCLCFTSAANCSCCQRHILDGQVDADCVPTPLVTCNYSHSDGRMRWYYYKNRFICLENWTWTMDAKILCVKIEKDYKSDCLSRWTYALIGASFGVLLTTILTVPILVLINMKLSRIQTRMNIRCSLDAIVRRRLFPNGTLETRDKDKSIVPNGQKTYNIADVSAKGVVYEMPGLVTDDGDSSDGNSCSDSLYINTRRK